MENIHHIAQIINKLETSDEIQQFFGEILTQSELETLSKRWRILTMLADGFTQRKIARALNVSLCKVTRGAKILKNQDAIATKYLIKEKENDN